MTRRIIPCLWLDEAEAAADRYCQIFPRSHVVARSHYPVDRDNPGGRPRGSVLTIELELAGCRFTALAGGSMFKPNPSISFFVHAADPAEADRLYGELADGGAALMPIGTYPWSERYGWVADRFGVSWQVITGARTAEGPLIVPSLMFANAQAGQAEAAITAYTRAFSDGRILSIARYGADEGQPGWVKHGRFVIGHTELAATDSHLRHGFDFGEGVSLQVMCVDQAEVDHYWEALAVGGSHGPCGWLRDRFGVSWQVVPATIATLLASPDAAARDRAFAAIMGMTKLDVGAIERAFAGG